MKRAALAVACAIVASAACSDDDDERPPPPTPDIHPLACAALQNGTTDGKRVLVDGVSADCAAAGLQCPLFGASFATCDAGERPMAMCLAHQWIFSCAEQTVIDGGDASAGDARSD
jgi:hypothetical protein